MNLFNRIGTEAVKFQYTAEINRVDLDIPTTC